ncbi:MAG TPA: ATP-binding protein, partial [Candidatus Methylomirabilis sp.]|nr:ATP-binding protein [Candidatus Methylomirabilis sp.]
PRERELLDMLSEFLAVAIRNSRLYGQMAETKLSLEQLVRAAGDAIISVTRDNTIQGWNPAAERIFGWPPAHALGRPLTDLLPEAPYAAARAALSPAQHAATFETTARRDDGRPLTLAVTLSALPGPSPAPNGLLAIVRDTTAQKEMEAQMHQSEKLTALGQMAGGIAHDFNNLLQAILGYAQLMGKNPANVDVVRRGLEVIEKAATGGAETVRRIQKFARLRPEEAFIALDLDQVVRDALAITRPRWEEKKLKAGLPLSLDLHLGHVPPVMGRPAELNEVVTNLILNAIDAMPHGGTLRLSTHRQGDRLVVFTATDTGIGMTEDVRKRIFDPFFTTKGDEGTGLGLPVSYSIVKRHGGDLRVDSRPGAGSTFTVLLPVGAAAPPDPPPPALRPGARKGRILLVDNDPQVMTILGEMLRDAGHHVVPVGDGPDALRLFRPGAFDLVLTNIAMAGMSGWELAEQVRADDPEVPLVFITGWGMQEQDQARCRGLGISALLFKPVRPDELHAAVQTALSEPTTRMGATP